MKLDNAVAVVTGGASGLGLATVEAFLAKGAKVAVFDMNEAAGQAVAAANPGRVIFQKVNVADADSATAGIAATMAAFGAIHVAVNCAGVGTASKILDRDSKALPLEAFNKTIQVNLVGTFNICRLAAEEMAKNAPDADGQRATRKCKNRERDFHRDKTENQQADDKHHPDPAPDQTGLIAFDL